MSSYDRVMKKVNRFYNKPRKEELYNLDSSIIEFLLPRLKQFIINSSEIIDWEYEKSQGVDIIGKLESIIVDFEYIVENKYEWDVKTSKECVKRSKRSFKLLGDIFFYLWI